MKKHLFNSINWTKLERSTEQKHNVLLSLFAILGIFTSIIQIAVDFINFILVGVVVDSLILLVMSAVYFLNENKKHLPARILFLSFLNIILFVFACIVPKTNGVYIFYFPVIAVTSLIFDRHSASIRNFFITLSIVFVLLLEVTNYQFFGTINIQEGIVDNYSFTINLFISLLVVVVSIYQMRKINHEIDQKRIMIANELKLKNEALKKSNTELDYFFYSTSHDLKAPLSSISGLINIAKHDVKDTKAMEYFNLIDKSVSKLNLFIKDIIDLSKNSSTELSKESVEFSQLVENVVDNNRYMSIAKSIEFKTDIIANSSIKVDKSRIEVILNNLISNAIKYHKKEGKLYILISIKKIVNSLEIIVKDNGKGIDEEHQEKVFDMFYRGHETSEGSGLGLYIVGDVVSKLNGEVSLKSRLDIGTEFKVTIPIQ